MWKVILPALALCCLLTANAALAEVTIGIVDMQIIFTESEPAKKVKTTMTTKFGKERERLEEKGKEVQKLAEAIKNSGSGTTREAIDEKRAKFMREQQDLEQKARDHNTRADQEQARLLKELQDVVFQAAKEFAQKKGITYLASAGAGSGILYADDSMDVTKDFLEEVNRVFKANPPSSSNSKSSKDSAKNNAAKKP